MAVPSSTQSVSLEAEARSITRRVRRGALAWFLLIAALRDWRLPNPDQSDVSTS